MFSTHSSLIIEPQGLLGDNIDRLVAVEATEEAGTNADELLRLRAMTEIAKLAMEIRRMIDLCNVETKVLSGRGVSCARVEVRKS